MKGMSAIRRPSAVGKFVPPVRQLLVLHQSKSIRLLVQPGAGGCLVVSVCWQLAMVPGSGAGKFRARPRKSPASSPRAASDIMKT